MKLLFLLYPLFSSFIYCDQLTLQSLKEQLIKNHILLKSASLQVDSARATAKSEGFLPNPMLKFGFSPKPVSTKNGDLKSKVSITQAIPAKSQLHFKKQVAFNRVDIQKLLAQKTLQDLLLELETHFFEYKFLLDKKAVLTDNLSLINSWVKLWETHYSHHNFQYQRLIQLQLDSREIQDQIRSIDEQTPILFEQLLQLAWIENTKPVDIIFDKKVSDDNFTLDISTNLQIQILQAQAQVKQSQIKLEHSFFKPKLTLGTEWSQIDAQSNNPDQGNDAWMISLGVDLVLNKAQIKNKVQSKKLSFLALQNNIRHQTRQIENEWKQILFNLNDSRTRYRLLKEDLIPRTREALDSIQTSYLTQSKGIDFFSLLSHLRKLLSLSLQMQNQYKIYFQSKAKIKHIQNDKVEL